MAKVKKCNVCECKATFSTVKAAWEHYSSVHVKRHYICLVCLDEHENMTTFNRHWQIIHKNIPDMEKYTRFIEMVRPKKKKKTKIESEVIFFSLVTFSVVSQTSFYRNYLRKLQQLLHHNPADSSTSSFESPTPIISTQSLGEPSRRTDALFATTNRRIGILGEYDAYMEYYNYVKQGFNCHICRKFGLKKRFSSRQSLLSHLRNSHNRVRFPRTPDFSPSIQSFRKRLLLKFKAMTCLICNRNYQSRERLKAHIRDEHQIEIQCCSHPLCTEAFVSETNLERHVRNQHRQTNVCMVFPEENDISLKIIEIINN